MYSSYDEIERQELITKRFWESFKRSWVNGGSKRGDKAWVDRKELSKFGLPAHIMKKTIDRYLSDLSKGSTKINH